MRGIIDTAQIKRTAKYNTAELSRLLGLDRSTVRRLADKRILRGRRGVNGRRWFAGADVINFVERY